MSRSVSTELRDDICVIRCGGVEGSSLAEELPGEVGRCLGAGIAAVVVDLDPWKPMDDSALEALQTAAHAFSEAGAALVVAVEVAS